ncbi:MAG: toluene monooxygenase [Nitrospiraceae bacterium]
MSHSTHTGGEHLVGPVLRGVDGDLIDAVIAAAELDNPGTEVVVDDHRGYVRVHTPRRFRLTRATLEAVLGRPFQLGELEPSLAGFAGRLQQSDDEWVWYLELEREGSNG